VLVKKLLIFGVALVVLLAGCGAETKKADGTDSSEKQQVEKTAPVIEDMYAAEDVAKAAAAANAEVTLEVLDKMSGNYATLLGNCQLIKFQQENGAAAMRQWTEDFAEDGASASSGDVVSVQEKLIKEGYSCTFKEMNQVASTGTLSEQ
jgi:outer membrane murein-binding lipoprotein Lpp